MGEGDNTARRDNLEDPRKILQQHPQRLCLSSEDCQRLEKMVWHRRDLWRWQLWHLASAKLFFLLHVCEPYSVIPGHTDKYEVDQPTAKLNPRLLQHRSLPIGTDETLSDFGVGCH